MYKKAVLITGSGFLLNISAGWFALLFIYSDISELLLKGSLAIISFIFATQLQKNSYEL
jgi:hypothetical protein